MSRRSVSLDAPHTDRYTTNTQTDRDKRQRQSETETETRGRDRQRQRHRQRRLFEAAEVYIQRDRTN
eukprot:600482-Pleurochrysis_carterae.AAC.2